MQERRNEKMGESTQSEQTRQNPPVLEGRDSFELIKIDRQEGNMNHGTLGGNFGEDVANKADEQISDDQSNDHFSPPY